MAYIIVNGHGGRYNSVMRYTTLISAFEAPIPSITVHFFCPDGQKLFNDKSWELLAYLLAGSERNAKSYAGHTTYTHDSTDTLTLTGGKRWYNYSCWSNPSLKDANKIFLCDVKSTRNRNKMLPGFDLTTKNGVGVTNCFQLNQLYDYCESYSVRDIYWLACREKF